jgi:hypothetical protein
MDSKREVSIQRWELLVLVLDQAESPSPFIYLGARALPSAVTHFVTLSIPTSPSIRSHLKNLKENLLGPEPAYLIVSERQFILRRCIHAMATLSAVSPRSQITFSCGCAWHHA